MTCVRNGQFRGEDLATQNNSGSSVDALNRHAVGKRIRMNDPSSAKAQGLVAVNGLLIARQAAHRQEHLLDNRFRFLWPRSPNHTCNSGHFQFSFRLSKISAIEPKLA